MSDLPTTVKCIVEAGVKPGHLEELKRLLEKTITAIEAQDPLTWSYEFYFNDDETKMYVIEWYKDAASAVAHEPIVRPYGEQLVEHIDMIDFIVVGAVSPELTKFARDWMPETKIYNWWNGFGRVGLPG